MITTVVHIVDPDPIQAHKKNNDNLNYYHFNAINAFIMWNRIQEGKNQGCESAFIFCGS